MLMMQAALTTTLSLGSTACLLTDEPDFSPPDPSAPTLIPVAPAVTELVILSPMGAVFSPQQFSVDVRSEDGEGNDLLGAVLLLDYGTPNELGTDENGDVIIQPYKAVLDSNEVEAGSLADPKPRRVTLGWQPDQLDPDQPECHSITLQVHRETLNNPFHLKNCPRGDQFARMTWFVALCNQATVCDFSRCLNSGATDAYCPNTDEQKPVEGAQ